MDPDLHIFVFSYNRGRYLRNCLQSVTRHCPGRPVTVIDDGSEDPEVAATLGDFEDRVSSVRRGDHGDAYLGGLYANMQFALDSCADSVYALFIQDDMQLLRDIERRDTEHWDRFFGHYDRAIQLAVTFLKPNRRANSLAFFIDRDVPVYLRDPAKSRRANFSAVGLFHAARMREVGWHFAASEGENDVLVEQQQRTMGISPYPLMMWLPNAESSKFRRRGLLHRFAEWYRDVGFYPYRSLTSHQLEWLFTRDLDELPVAQQLLVAEGLDRDRLWLFEDATKSIRPIHRYLKRRKKRLARRT